MVSEAIPGEALRPVRNRTIDKQLGFWQCLDVVKHSRLYTDLIFACLLPDALPRPAPELNFEVFGQIWGPCGDPSDLHTYCFANVCAVELLLDFCWILFASLATGYIAPGSRACV